MTVTILIVEDEENARKNIASFLTTRGYEVIDVATLAEARECIRAGAADVILLDVRLPDGYGPSLLEETAYLEYAPPIIVITGYAEIDMAVDAMKNGAQDFIQKPIEFSRLETTIQRASEKVAMRRELAHYRQAQHKELGFVVGESKAMRDLLDYAQRAAAASVSVLITGETGSGKEVLARAIHRMGPRAEKPFIDINCAAIQTTMLESELFGHEAGAFTGADKRKLGLMEYADGGILFLDEISTMPLDMQAKLLRALEDRSLRRVGGSNKIHVDVQIIAASNRDLPAMIEKGEFREDLFYRLKVLNLHIPPLREHKKDIPALVGHFLCQLNPQRGVNVTDVTPRAMKALIAYRWPGNIRQLHNVIERALLFCEDSAIDLAQLPPELLA
ncbi:MAG TPA: sigma-54 dependent transcriptional regulator [Anaerolineales bacterium]|jgi:DNA-binding NtrC family response regulator|nr:sigma-54 dependent transcriptional regulator [Anaerolineales bacterium]